MLRVLAVAVAARQSMMPLNFEVGPSELRLVSKFNIFVLELIYSLAL